MGGFKFKNRYLVCQITFKDGRGISPSSSSASSSSALLKSVRDSLGVLFGDVGRGASLASCQVNGSLSSSLAGLQEEVGVDISQALVDIIE